MQSFVPLSEHILYSTKNSLNVFYDPMNKRSLVHHCYVLLIVHLWGADLHLCSLQVQVVHSKPLTSPTKARHSSHGTDTTCSVWRETFRSVVELVERQGSDFYHCFIHCSSLLTRRFEWVNISNASFPCRDWAVMRTLPFLSGTSPLARASVTCVTITCSEPATPPTLPSSAGSLDSPDGGWSVTGLCLRNDKYRVCFRNDCFFFNF